MTIAVNNCALTRHHKHMTKPQLGPPGWGFVVSYVRRPAMLQRMGSRSRSPTLVLLRVRSDRAADPTSQDGHRAYKQAIRGA